MLAELSITSTNLPAEVSSFVGRERELAEIARLLREHRLVTLTGPGGTGKTRLAQRAAATELDRYAEGVWLVELAAITLPELVVETIANVLHIPEASDRQRLDSLTTVLRGTHRLLVLDNCEHLLGECARVVAYILARCPKLAVLATSREPLAIRGERVLRLPPLSLPESARDVAVEHLLDFDAVRLFVERAQAAEPSFQLSGVTAPAVVDICRRLDGIPLALELAAMRVRGMGVAYLVARMDDRFRLLTSGDRSGEPRQRTLLAMVDWSYDLLPEHERVVLHRVCIFTGSFAPEAAESVCAGEFQGEHGRASVRADTVFDALLSLVEKSLIQFDQESGRYRVLETIRLYGLERLLAAGETNFLSRQHLVYYLQMIEDGADFDGGPGEEAWYRRLELEHDNLRATLAWAIQSKRVDEATRLALGLWRFWRSRTFQREGLRWLEQILALDASNPIPDSLRPRLYNALGVLAHLAHYFDRATRYHEEALRLWTVEGDEAGIAQALFDIGWQAFDQVDLTYASQCAARSLALAERRDDKRLIANALLLDAVSYASADFSGILAPKRSGGVESAEGAISALERSLTLWREIGDMDNLARTLATLGMHYIHIGQAERGKPLLAESARIHISRGSYGNMIGTIVGLMGVGRLVADQAVRAPDVARVIGMMEAWNDATAAAPSPWMMSPVNLMVAETLKQTLGPEGFAQAFDEGRRLSATMFLELVDRMTAPEPGAPGPSHAISSARRATHDGLTARELDVLRFVAKGMTNAQVARELTITPRTVNAHLTAIYAKLGVTARGGAIRYAVDHHLA